MAIKVLNPKTNRYNKVSTMDKPTLRKIARKMSSSKSLSTKLTKKDLGKMITKKCRSVTKPRRSSSVRRTVKRRKLSSSSKSKVKSHLRTIGRGASKRTIRVKSFRR